MNWKIALAIVLAPLVLSFAFYVFLRVVARNVPTDRHAAALRQTISGLYGWVWLLCIPAWVISIIGVIAGFASWTTLFWFFGLGAVSKGILRATR